MASLRAAATSSAWVKEGRQLRRSLTTSRELATRTSSSARTPREGVIRPCSWVAWFLGRLSGAGSIPRRRLPSHLLGSCPVRDLLLSGSAAVGVDGQAARRPSSAPWPSPVRSPGGRTRQVTGPLAEGLPPTGPGSAEESEERRPRAHRRSPGSTAAGAGGPSAHGRPRGEDHVEPPLLTSAGADAGVTASPGSR